MNQISLSSLSFPEHAPNTFLALYLSTTVIFFQSSGNTSLPPRTLLNFWNSVQHSSLFNHSLLPSPILPCHHLTPSALDVVHLCSFLHCYILCFPICLQYVFTSALTPYHSVSFTYMLTPISPGDTIYHFIQLTPEFLFHFWYPICWAYSSITINNISFPASNSWSRQTQHYLDTSFSRLPLLHFSSYVHYGKTVESIFSVSSLAFLFNMSSAHTVYLPVYPYSHLHNLTPFLLSCCLLTRLSSLLFLCSSPIMYCCTWLGKMVNNLFV